MLCATTKKSLSITRLVKMSRSNGNMVRHHQNWHQNQPNGPQCSPMVLGLAAMDCCPWFVFIQDGVYFTAGAGSTHPVWMLSQVRSTDNICFGHGWLPHNTHPKWQLRKHVLPLNKRRQPWRKTYELEPIKYCPQVAQTLRVHECMCAQHQFYIFSFYCLNPLIWMFLLL